MGTSPVIGTTSYLHPRLRLALYNIIDLLVCQKLSTIQSCASKLQHWHNMNYPLILYVACSYCSQSHFVFVLPQLSAIVSFIHFWTPKHIRVSDLHHDLGRPPIHRWALLDRPCSRILHVQSQMDPVTSSSLLTVICHACLWVSNMADFLSKIVYQNALICIYK